MSSFSLTSLLLSLIVGFGKSSLLENVFSSEVFILPLSHHNFSLPFSGVDYRPSIAHLPDLPSWLHYSYSNREHLGYVYGVPPDTGKIQLEVIATDRQTYKVKRKLFDIDIQPKERRVRQVKFKIVNMNVDELLVSSVRQRLYNILVDDIWPKSIDDLVVTSLASATDVGDQLPLNPHDREGCYISFGSNAPFSDPLKELEQEAKLLWNHQPCPTYFKKASYERFFRQKHFSVDWCSFKLYENAGEQIEEVLEDRPPLNNRFPVFSALEKEGNVRLMKKSEVIVRSFVFDVIHTILVPLAVMLVLLGLLTLAMCCHSTNIIPKTQDIQMVQYASVNRASEVLRNMAGREHSPHPSMATTTTQADTFPRSRTGSPASTMQHNTSLRRYEDFATLSRPDPPPYQRNGSTPSRYDD